MTFIFHNNVMEMPKNIILIFHINSADKTVISSSQKADITVFLLKSTYLYE